MFRTRDYPAQRMCRMLQSVQKLLLCPKISVMEDLSLRIREKAARHEKVAGPLTLALFCQMAAFIDNAIWSRWRIQYALDPPGCPSWTGTHKLRT